METARTPEKQFEFLHLDPLIKIRMEAFLEDFARHCNVGRACRTTDVGRTTVWRWRKDDPWFSERYDEAEKIGFTALEDEMRRRAYEGMNKPLSHQGQFTYLRDLDAIDPDTGKRYPPELAPLLRDENGKPVVATVQEFSDTLAIFLAKAHNPEKYRENSRVELAGSVAIGTMTEDEIRTELATLGAVGVLPAPTDGFDDLV